MLHRGFNGRTSFTGLVFAAALAALAGAPAVALAQFEDQGSKQDLFESAQEATRASFDFEDVEHHMGTVLQTERPEFDFEFKNTGGSTLEIIKVQPSCGCTVAEMTKKSYAPGESGKIHVKYDPSGKFGPQSKHITVETNDPKHPNVMLRFAANVEAAVMVEPRIINFGQVNKDEERKLVVEVTGRTEDFEATFATVQRSEMLEVKKLDDKPVEVEVAGKKMRRTRFELTLKPSATVGKIVDLLTVRTTDTREPVVNCSVAGNITGDLRPDPMVMTFGAVIAGSEFNGQLRLVHRLNKAYKIEKVEARQPNPGNVQVSFEPEGDPSAGVYVIKATGTAAQPRTTGIPITGTIVVTTDVPGERTIEIPYSLQIRMAPRNIKKQ